jgi:hypothetical protein
MERVQRHNDIPVNGGYISVYSVHGKVTRLTIDHVPVVNRIKVRYTDGVLVGVNDTTGREITKYIPQRRPIIGILPFPEARIRRAMRQVARAVEWDTGIPPLSSPFGLESVHVIGVKKFGAIAWVHQNTQSPHELITKVLGDYVDKKITARRVFYQELMWSTTEDASRVRKRVEKAQNRARRRIRLALVADKMGISVGKKVKVK